MEELRPREIVILASDYEKLVRCYRDVLGMRVTDTCDDEFHYCLPGNGLGHQDWHRPGCRGKGRPR